MNKGKLYIIPVPISEDTNTRVLPDFNKAAIQPLRIFVVEKLKTARQFLRKTDAQFPIDDCVFFEQDKHSDYDFHPDVVNFLNAGKDVGLMSESGYPGVADPGSRIVAFAHDNGCQVIPLVGPSSVLMALAASGMNGQGFTFHGYLPVGSGERQQKLKELVVQIQRTGFAQLFIETPYRNAALFDDILKSVPDNLRCAVAYDITGVSEKISSQSIKKWKQKPFSFEKMPCVFVLGN